MKLKAARIQNLRCVEDSREFTLADVTCLVGKNESGKTTVLRGLHKLNPDSPNQAKFDPLDDYPRRRLATYRARHEKTPDPILTTYWELGDNDLEGVRKKLGPSTLTGKSVTISKGYDNKLTVEAKIDETALVNHLLGLKTLSTEEQTRVGGAASLQELRDRLSGSPPLTASLTDLQTLVTKQAPDWNSGTMLSGVIAPLIPKFLYFADYEKMSGRVALDDFLQKKSAKQLSEGQRIFGALLDLANTSAEELKNLGKFEALKAELEAVSNRITAEVFGYWTQNEQLSVEFDLRTGMPQDPAPFNSGLVFHTRVRNELHQVSVTFDERSTGFIWFFSFLVWFSQLRATYGPNIIILLDEPGLSLHGRAQQDLLRFVNERLRPDYQVVYTTHSPFMVDPDNLLAVRTVEDRSTSDNIVGTVVSDRVLSSDRDTLFPLQAAIGYDIAQSLFVGKHTLLVEGPSDLLYFKWASSELEKQGRTSLDQRWVICPTGGIDKFWSFVALFGGNRLDLSVVSDFHHGDKNRLRALRDSKIIPSERVLTADAYAGQEEADIEDILGRDFYFALVNHAYALPPAEALRIDGEAKYVTRVVEDVESHFQRLASDAGPVTEFDHFLPSSWLVENSGQARSFKGYDAALQRFEVLFRDLNAMLPPRAPTP